jgi:hypothetical protein
MFWVDTGCDTEKTELSLLYSEENAVKMRSFKYFSLRLRLRRFYDGINRGIDAMKI